MTSNELVFDTPRQKAEHVRDLTDKRIPEIEKKIRAYRTRGNNTMANFCETTLKTNLMLNELAKEFLGE